MIHATSWPVAGGGGIACAGHDSCPGREGGGGWSVGRLRGRAGDLHGRDPWAAGVGRGAWLCDCARPALVLGSAQPDRDVDRERAAGAGVEVARRRSGGGAVLVVPGRTVWVDITVPAGDRLWDADVGRAFWWVGQLWAGVLDRLGLGPSLVHRGGLVRTPWSGRICFAGLGPGEVTVDGRKVVGLSQRRTREGAVFHCAAVLALEARRTVDLLALAGGQAEEAVAALEAAAAPLGARPGCPPVTAAMIEAALLDALP
ncbi:MAG: lipoyl protein ligase domain-containing protein [Acidimicrobiales bacterium]